MRKRVSHELSKILAGETMRALNPYTFSFVMGLLKSRSPLTVIRKVSEIVIDSFKSKAIRSRSHISIEVLKLMPTLTNSYSTATIVLKCFIGGVFASLYHRRPYPMKFRTGLPMSIFSVSVFPTTARFGCSTRQAFTENNPLFSTIASAKILDLIMDIVFYSFQNSNIMELHADKVYVSHRHYDKPMIVLCQGVF